MSDVEDVHNDFELMEGQSKYLLPIKTTDIIEKLGILQSIINKLFTIRGQTKNDLIYEDAVIVMKDTTVLGHVIDVYGSFDDAVNYCCVKSLNCPEAVWEQLADDMANDRPVELFAVQSLSSKMDRLVIKELQKEDDDFTHQSDAESNKEKEDTESIEDGEEEEGEITKDSYLAKYTELYNILDPPMSKADTGFNCTTSPSISVLASDKNTKMTQLPGLMPVYTTNK